MIARFDNFPVPTPPLYTSVSALLIIMRKKFAMTVPPKTVKMKAFCWEPIYFLPICI